MQHMFFIASTKMMKGFVDAIRVCNVQRPGLWSILLLDFARFRSLGVLRWLTRALNVEGSAESRVTSRREVKWC